MKKLKELSQKKVVKIISFILKALCVVIILAFVALVYLQRFTDNKVSFFSFRMFTVVSESMKPHYDIGDVLFSKKVDLSKIKIDDDLTYEGTMGSLRGKVVTHRVVDIKKDEDGKYLFYTKGTANLIQDPVVSEEQVLGKVVYKSFILSTIYGIISNNIGFYLCIILPIMFIIGSEIFATLLEKEEKRRNSKAQE